MTLQFRIAAFPETSASTLFGLHDVFTSVGSDWRLLCGEPPGPPMIASALVAEGASTFECHNGVAIKPDLTCAAADRADVVCVPDVVIALDRPPHGLRPKLVEWIRTLHERGAVIASACSGSLLLAEAGLLDGQQASVHWGYADYMRRHYPDVDVRPERTLCLAGEAERIITAGGAAAWHDLALYLIARFCGAEHAVQTAKVHLLQWHAEGQLPYACTTAGRRHDDSVVQTCQVWLAQHYDEPNPVAAAAVLSGLPERTFNRRFRAATGHTPLDYVHHLRVEEAKQALEATDDAIDDISESVGYSDPTFFRRLFKRKTGITPHQYRRKFRLPGLVKHDARR